MNRIEYFNWVRDIPYRCPLNAEEPDYCCLGKHKILERLLKNAGLEVRPKVCDSDWSSLNLPTKIINLPHEDEIFHVYLEVKINGKWKQIDASLDRGLAPKFPLIEWDGHNDTLLCIEPKGTTYSPKSSLEIYHEVENDFTSDKEFYSSLNNWLEEIRKK